MLTYNMDQHDKLINGTILTIINIHDHFQNSPVSGTLHVKFKYEKAGNKYTDKDTALRG